MVISYASPLQFCRLQDLAGYGVAFAVGQEYAKAFSDRIFESPLLELLVKEGRNGKHILFLGHFFSLITVLSMHIPYWDVQ